MLQPALDSLPTSVQRTIELIVLHCSATPSGKPIANVMATIDGWHRERGFKRSSPLAASFNPTLKSIGYHFVIDLDGTIYSGRHLDEVGAHVSGFNAKSAGICLVGGAERDARYTAAQWASAAQLVFKLANLLHVSTTAIRLQAGKGVCGHRDLSPDLNGDGVIKPNEWLKTCPGFDVSAWIERGFVPTPDQVLPMAGPTHA